MEMSKNIPSGAAVATVGSFDGVHRGHQAVLDKLVAERELRGGEGIVFTFHPHPLAVVAPERVPLLITSGAERDALLQRAGVRVENLEFTRELAGLTAEMWLKLIRDNYGVRTIVVGYDNTFGCDGVSLQMAGISEMARSLSMEAVEAPVVNGCSSSAVRRAVAEGRMNDASEMLGRAFRREGKVVHGRGVGSKIGVPTANLEIEPGLIIPAPGVYAAYATIPDGNIAPKFPTVVNIGVRPTFADDNHLSVEAHIIGYDGDLYDANLSLDFISKLRDEQKFDSVDALKKQIIADKEAALELLQRE